MKHEPGNGRGHEWGHMRGLKRGGDDAVVAALQSELVLLRDENAQLRLERQQSVTPASSTARVANMVDALSQRVDPGEVEWATLSEALVLRECLVSMCDELERGLGAVRRQLQSAAPVPERDRRTVDRRSASTTSAQIDFARDADGARATGS